MQWTEEHRNKRVPIHVCIYNGSEPANEFPIGWILVTSCWTIWELIEWSELFIFTALNRECDRTWNWDSHGLLEKEGDEMRIPLAHRCSCPKWTSSQLISCTCSFLYLRGNWMRSLFYKLGDCRMICLYTSLPISWLLTVDLKNVFCSNLSFPSSRRNWIEAEYWRNINGQANPPVEAETAMHSTTTTGRHEGISHSCRIHCQWKLRDGFSLPVHILFELAPSLPTQATDDHRVRGHFLIITRNPSIIISSSHRDIGHCSCFLQLGLFRSRGSPRAIGGVIVRLLGPPFSSAVVLDDMHLITINLDCVGSSSPSIVPSAWFYLCNWRPKAGHKYYFLRVMSTWIMVLSW